MALDAYITWKGKPEELEKTHYVSAVYGGQGIDGASGYLCEKYFLSEHYMIKALFPKQFVIENPFSFMADYSTSEELRQNIPATLEQIALRELEITQEAAKDNAKHIIFDEDYTIYQAIRTKTDEVMKFLELFEKFEREGKQPLIEIWK